MDKELLQQSFALIRVCAPDFLHHFYERLFLRFPQAKALFKSRTIEEQERLLLDMLAVLVDQIDDEDALRVRLHPLGAKHADYGVTEEMYDLMRDALIGTIEHVSGVTWTDELALAWNEAYDRIAALMLEGARQSAKPK